MLRRASSRGTECIGAGEGEPAKARNLGMGQRRRERGRDGRDSVEVHCGYASALGCSDSPLGASLARSSALALDGQQEVALTEGTGRIEAFSDGVFAIAITLLILEIRLPHAGAEGSLWIALVALWPSYLAFALSFFVILVTWIVHHDLMRLIHTTTHAGPARERLRTHLCDVHPISDGGARGPPRRSGGTDGGCLLLRHVRPWQWRVQPAGRDDRARSIVSPGGRCSDHRPHPPGLSDDLRRSISPRRSLRSWRRTLALAHRRRGAAAPAPYPVPSRATGIGERGRTDRRDPLMKPPAGSDPMRPINRLAIACAAVWSLVPPHELMAQARAGSFTVVEASIADMRRARAEAHDVARNRAAVPDADREVRAGSTRSSRSTRTRWRSPTRSTGSAPRGASADRCTGFRSRSRTTSTRRTCRRRAARWRSPTWCRPTRRR